MKVRQGGQTVRGTLTLEPEGLCRAHQSQCEHDVLESAHLQHDTQNVVDDTGLASGVQAAESA